MRRSYAPARVTCPLTLCDWSASTGKPKGRQEWAKLHLELAEMVVEHLTNDHRVDRIGPPTCTALGTGVGGKLIACTLPRQHDGAHQDEDGATWVAREVYP